MTKSNGATMTRRGLLGAFAATAITAAPTYSNAFGFLRGAGDVRRVKMYATRTGESIDMIYWVEGEYIKDALKEINWFMRDWRQDKSTNMDTRTVDLIAATQNLLKTNNPFLLLSGYRTPQTNSMLRNSGRGVAKQSYHMKAQAADLRMEGRSVRQVSRAALSCTAGGVGRYSGSNFTHVDCGPIRNWGR
ncbi:MAG: YcbK family protein [Planktomarina sp.]